MLVSLTCSYWFLYTTSVLGFVLAHLGLCISKHPTHDAVFDNKYMKLSGASLNAIVLLFFRFLLFLFV